MKLTQQQIDDFNREGWLFLPELFSPEEVALLAQEAVGIYDNDRPEVWGAALFVPQLRAVVVVDAHGLVRKQRYFFRAEQLGQEQPALAVEIVDLLLGQFHGGSSFWFLILPRHGRACPGHPRLRLAPREDVDARHKAGHDACYAARLGAFSLSSVIRPALIACASAALSAAFALPDRIWAAMVSCSAQALWR